VADAMLECMGADIAICNAGTIRGDSFYPAGTLLTQADLVREFPFANGVIVIKLSGQTLLEALEQVRVIGVGDIYHCIHTCTGPVEG
jgi:2',3'-cyclic-nucleotide 2'-phosphodiesterase (5'-nucleotidase family)